MYEKFYIIKEDKDLKNVLRWYFKRTFRNRRV